MFYILTNERGELDVPQFNKEKTEKVSTCNRFDFKTLGY